MGSRSFLQNDSEFHVGEAIRVIMNPDGAVFSGVFTDWDEFAIYINGLGFPHEDILAMEPADLS